MYIDSGRAHGKGLDSLFSFATAVQDGACTVRGSREVSAMHEGDGVWDNQSGLADATEARDVRMPDFADRATWVS